MIDRVWKVRACAVDAIPATGTLFATKKEALERIGKAHRRQYVVLRVVADVVYLVVEDPGYGECGVSQIHGAFGYLRLARKFFKRYVKEHPDVKDALELVIKEVRFK